MSDYKRMLVTSALPYANGPIHLGHLAGAYLPADIFVRYQKLKKQDVVFVCGSDEHGVPITLLAEKRGVTPQDIVDEFHERNKQSFFDFGIRFDNYSRTSQPEHKKLSQEFFLKLKENDYLTPKTSQQFFSPKGQRFLPDRYVEGTCPFCGADGARGDQCDSCGKWIDQTKLINPISKIDGDTPELRDTTHWYLKLGDFQEKIIEWLDTKDNWKSNVLNFCKGWFAEGLRDRSVTRDLSWGIPVPVEGYEDKVLYVWFDAP
ncbi:class I tRNA ligase family protein, partial [bacterium]|nr:class I tRNA ligase family protein [bacterium]